MTALMTVNGTLDMLLGEHFHRISEALADLAATCYTAAASKGWWEEDRNVGEMLALMHSEISEALEEYRKGKPLTGIYYSDGGKPEGFPVELADLLIRTCDLCGRNGINIGEAIRMKLAYNQTRPHRHGGLKC